MPASKSAKAKLELQRLRLRGYIDLIRIHRNIERRASALLLEEGFSDMTLAQATALMVLVQEREPITAVHLARLLDVSQVTVSRFVKRLTERKWIKRKPHPTDSRAMLLAPTKKTLDNLPSFLSVTNQLLDEAYDGYTVGELRTLLGFLGRTLENLRAPDDEDADEDEDE